MAHTMPWQARSYQGKLIKESLQSDETQPPTSI